MVCHVAHLLSHTLIKLLKILKELIFSNLKEKLMSIALIGYLVAWINQWCRNSLFSLSDFFHALDVAINCDRHSLSITLLRLNLVLIVFVARESVDS